MSLISDKKFNIKTKKKRLKWATIEGYKCKVITKWNAPDTGGVPILTMPNVPHPLHTVAPRTILGSSTWNHMRNKCYYDADYTCEVCGTKVVTEYNEDGSIKHQYNDDGTLPKRNLHAHELYSYDYDKGIARFERCVALCNVCHVNFIHSGRMLTMYKQGDPLTTKETVLHGIEHGFKQIYDWNKEHYGEEKLRVFFAILEYLKVPELHDDIEALIDKYEIEFYVPMGEMMTKDNPVWNGWKLIIGNKEYPSPFHSRKEWEDAMETQNKKQLEQRKSWINRFKKFDGLDSITITDDDMKKIDDVKIPDDF